MNKVKEIEMINADLLHREKKLTQLNEFQYKSMVKETLEPNEAH